MHIPDGFLATPVWAGLDTLAVPTLGYLVHRAQRDFEESKIPLLGIMGAFVFAAQMVNFPVGAGTSGHLVGGALLAITLGPAAAGVVMTVIVAIQALVFQDGGVLALGANTVNMALVGVLAGYLPFHFWGAGPWRKLAIFLAGTLSVLASSVLALAELLVSGVSMPAPLVLVSLGLFLFSALLEGAITLAVAQTLATMRPEFVRTAHPGRSYRLVLVAVAAVILVVGSVVFASTYPDGIRKLTDNLGITAPAKTLIPTPLAGYEAGSFQSAWLRKASAGMIGLALIYAGCAFIGRLLAKNRLRGSYSNVSTSGST